MKDFNLEFSSEINYSDYENLCFTAMDTVLNRSGLGNDMLGWLTLPETYDRDEYERMKLLSENVKKAEVLVVIGVGGSFLGSKAIIEATTSYYKKNSTEIVFVGNNLSGDYLKETVDYLKDKDYYINVISKSGTTFETAVAFRVLKKECEEKYGKDSVDRIIVTTDEKESVLRNYANKIGYENLTIPSDVGGRFSVFTPAGLFPIMCAGVDTDALLLGANDGMENFVNRDLSNPSLRYALLRNLLYKDGKKIEFLVVHEPKLEFIQEWWKQLFSESEGKGGKGLYTSSAIFTRDLHSFGQMMQQGNKIIFETIIKVDNLKRDISIPKLEENFDNLNYLENKSLNEINKVAVKATREAHNEGEVPTIKITVPKLDTYNIGKLIYFFEISCALSAYMLDVNPFNQPGVENYKKNMKELLKNL